LKIPLAPNLGARGIFMREDATHAWNAHMKSLPEHSERDFTMSPGNLARVRALFLALLLALFVFLLRHGKGPPFLGIRV
jgi:hypothetical protein